MSKPLRIEYKDAYYHVMNRGLGYKETFKEEADFRLFMEIIADASKRFYIEIHAYCLMSNHYHLLIKTPCGNLGRAMRHINGIYTQRRNRLYKTDGPLFRGRYKAILIDSDSYLLHLSKYIHMNPKKAKIVDSLDKYAWSSYSAYVGLASPPCWLFQDEIFGQLNTSINQAQAYAAFMQDESINKGILALYDKERFSPILANDDFINQLPTKVRNKEVSYIEQTQYCAEIHVRNILKAVSEEFNVSINDLVNTKRGKGVQNIPRKIAMYIMQYHRGFRLKEIAAQFNLAHYGGASSAINQVKKIIECNGELASQVNSIINRLDPYFKLAAAR